MKAKRYASNLIRALLGRDTSTTRQNKSIVPDIIKRPSSASLKSCLSIRGSTRPPVIFIHGVMRRSGTNYIGDMLNLHPDLHGFPNQVWEAPFLPTAYDLLRVQENFFTGYQRNRERFGPTDFLPLFGSAFIAHLLSFVPDGKQMLLKVPSVENLHLFRYVFPFEKALVLQRDGRDIVDSTIKTWPHFQFKNVCSNWVKAQSAVLSEMATGSDDTHICFARFEDAFESPQDFVQDVLGKLEVDATNYPFDEINNLKVKGSSEIRVDGKVTWKGIDKPKGFNPVGRWKKWTSKEKTAFKNIAGDILVQSGYVEDLSW